MSLWALGADQVGGIIMRSILLAVALVPFTLAPLAAQTLKGDELKTVLSGKSAIWQTKDGKLKGTGKYTADGKATVTGNFPGLKEDTGVWRIHGDKFCTKYKKLRGGKEACYSIQKLPDGSFDNGESIIKVN